VVVVVVVVVVGGGSSSSSSSSISHCVTEYLELNEMLTSMYASPRLAVCCCCELECLTSTYKGI
jgi:hypothetical protein